MVIKGVLNDFINQDGGVPKENNSKKWKRIKVGAQRENQKENKAPQGMTQKKRKSLEDTMEVDGVEEGEKKRALLVATFWQRLVTSPASNHEALKLELPWA